LAYDRWHFAEVLRACDRIGLYAYEGDPNWTNGLRIVKWGQGLIDMAPAVVAFEEAVLTGDLKHDGNPTLTYCVMNAIVQSDSAGNRKLDKEKSRNRIDGAVALAMALGLKVKDRQAVPVVSPWEDENFSIQVV
jgi:phage terminase large subunit-like protein